LTSCTLFCYFWLKPIILTHFEEQLIINVVVCKTTMPENRVCPRCDGDNITSLVWGYPNSSVELKKRIAKGEVELRGCCVSGDSKNFRCNNCYYEWDKFLK
jgi:hypothetical protein